jgi:EAL domain-containing protein (putative c-di-GMP-specific phosphodiesterase class I)
VGTTREADLIARPGGDEFMMLLSDLGQAGASRADADAPAVVAKSVAVRTQEALREPFVVGDTEVYVTASIGVSVFPHDADDGSSLLKNANAAMFESKKVGPGAISIHEREHAGSLGKLSLSTRLHKAVETTPWVLHYQPIVRLEDAEVTGVEALIRWQDPNEGLVPPGEFIPLAEELGLIEAIGDWVVEEIAAQGRAWHAQGLETEIGFNLSPRQLWQPDVAKKIVSRLAQAGMETNKILVEITESAAMTDPSRAHRVLSDLRSLGVRLAIDDFGTGYSSLARLKYLPVDVLKIDRSFVREIDSDPDARSMVSAMVGLALNLGITSLGEGIETEAEWRFLADLGCELGQGFLFSRPVTAPEVLTFVRGLPQQRVIGGGSVA